MNKDWTIVKLGQVSEIRSGFGFPKKLQGKTQGDYPFAKVRDISIIVRKGGYLINNAPNYIDRPEVKKIRAKAFPIGTIVFAKIGEAIRQNFRALTTRIMLFDNNVCGVIPNTQVVDTMFLLFFLSSIDLYPLAKTTSVPAINKAVLESIDLPLPPLTEQRRIATRIKEFIERVEEIEKLKERSIYEHEFLLESLIETALKSVEGELVRLGDVCKITSKLIDPRKQEYFTLLHVGGANIESKTGRLMDLKTAHDENLKSGKFLFNESMVLYNKIRPYLMKIARPDFPGLCSADMYPLSPDPLRLTRDYLFYMLFSREFTQYAQVGSNRAGIPKVNRNHLFEFEFKLPSIEDQTSIAQLLDSAFSIIEQLRHEIGASRSKISLIRESILRKAFSGEL
ncbi:MAG: restriction endonuclease subunit S [Pseudomonadota bacterium]